MSSDSSNTSAIRTIGRYQAFDELGRGAMGVVYRGFDPVIGRTVALKTLSIDTRDTQAQELRGRLYREAAAAGALSHPNIVTIFDIIEDAGVTAVAMEFIEGRSLAAIISEQSPLTLDLAIDIVEQLCSALDYAAGHGIVHRDIKPANILMTAAGRAKVTDFGVARLALSTMTQAGTVLGSPSYMSPEQVRGLPLDGRSDLFSAAVVFYEMLTHERPFAGNDIATTMYRIAHDPPTPPGQFNAAIGPEVTAVVERALAKNPDERYATGAEFVAQLRQTHTLGGSPQELAVAAGSPSDAPRLQEPTPGRRGTAPGPSQSTGSASDPAGTSPADSSGQGDDGAAGQMSAPPMPAQGPTATSASGRTVFWKVAGGIAFVIVVVVAAALLWPRGPARIDSTGASDQSQPGSRLPANDPAAVVDPAPSTGTPPAAARPAAAASAPPAPTPSTSARPGPAARPRAAGGGVAAPAGVTSPTQAIATPAPDDRPRPTSTGRVYTQTEVDERPQVLRQVAPIYPSEAAQRHLEDVVVLKVLVGESGRPDDIQILRGSKKDAAFDTAAVQAVRQWVFAPARKAGRAVACWYNIGVPFQQKP